jgi:hypothetical protein
MNYSIFPLKIIFIILIFCFNCKTITIEDVRADLQNKLQKGNIDNKILVYMKEKDIIKHGPFKYKKYMFDNFRDSMNEKWKDIDNYPISYYYTGVIKNISWDLFVSCDIYIRFYFNKNKELEGYVTDKICTGP